MRINTRNGKIEITKQEAKELQRAAATVENYQKFINKDTDVCNVPAYLRGLAESLVKPEEG